MQKSDLKEMEVTGKNKYYDDKAKETQQERLDKAIKAAKTWSRHFVWLIPTLQRI